MSRNQSFSTNRAGAFRPHGSDSKITKVAVTGSSAQHTFQRETTSALLANLGSEDVFFAFAGDNNPTATANDFPIRSGETLELPLLKGTSAALKVAFICTSSSDLRIIENAKNPA